MIITVSAFAETSTWESIKARGTLRIGVTQSPPWYFKNAQGNWSGLAIRVAQSMSATLGVKLELVDTTWKSAVSDIRQGKIDIMLVLDPTPERALVIDFPAQAMLYDALGVLVDKQIRVQQWSDLNNAVFRIGVVAGTVPDQFAGKYLPEARISRYKTAKEISIAFKSARVDAVCLFHPSLISILREAKRGKIILPAPIWATSTSAGVRRETDKTWRDWVGTTLDYYYNTGQTQAWFEDSLRELGVDPFGVPTISREHW